MGEDTKVKWLSKGMRLIQDNPGVFPHILR